MTPTDPGCGDARLAATIQKVKHPRRTASQWLVIQDWEHHELRRSRRDLYHLSHEVVLREAHAARQAAPGAWLAGHDFRAIALLCDAVEAYAATSRTGSRPPEEAAMAGDGVNAVVLRLAEALCAELESRRGEAEGAAVAAFTNLGDKADWAADVLRLRC